MRIQRHFLFALCILIGSVGSSSAAGDDDQPKAVAETAAAPVVELVICLDTSGSMSGLIDAARQKLWIIVNELATAKPTPSLRVALLTFGNDGHSQEDGWVRIDSDFTDDLDMISERLFALSTNGGTELVGRVMQTALDRLTWTASGDPMRIVFVAGNESADQDEQANYRDVAKSAIERGIIVNTIYCGPATDDIAPGWKDVALRADGRFASIDQNDGTVVIETPFDVDIATLNTALNATYIPYGAEGSIAQTRQVAQDANCTTLNHEAIATRAVWKANGLYNCATWDLVDAVAQPKFKWESIEVNTLPEAIQKMTLEERKAHVAKLAKTRAELQKKIQAKGKERDAFVKTKLVEVNGDRNKAFDEAILGAIRAQAESRGFRLDGK